MTTTPQAIKDEFLSLQSSELIELFQIDIETDVEVTTFRVTKSETILWDGNTYSNSPLLITGISKSSTGEFFRPKLTLPNPDGMFTYYANNNFLEGALVTRYQVHPDDVASGLAKRNRWFVSQVTSITNQSIGLQLRGLSDGNKFKIPGREYIQPEFPFVAF